MKKTISLAFVVLAACTSAFKYHYYGLQGVVYEQGTLLGPKAIDDLPFSDCAPTGSNKHPCVVLFAKDFFDLIQDYEDTQAKLSECQKQKIQSVLK